MKKENDVRLERIYEKQVKLFGKPLRVKGLILISFVGMLLCFFGYIKMSALIWFLIGFIFLCLFIFSFLLFRKSILYFGEYSVEVTASGDMFITKLFGQCSICLGELRIVKNSKGTFIQCKEDKTHIWDVYK